MQKPQKALVVYELGTNAAVAVAGSAGTDSNGNQPLTKELIERALDGLGIAHRRDAQGDIFVYFTDTKPRIGSDLNCWLMIDHGDILRVLATVDPKVPEENWSRAIVACNSHHQTARFGKVGLYTEVEQRTGRLFLDAQILLLHGASEDFLASFIMTNLGSAHSFFEIAYREGLYRNGKRRVNGKNAHTNADGA
jgi:hypothetical protein